MIVALNHDCFDFLSDVCLLLAVTSTTINLARYFEAVKAQISIIPDDDQIKYIELMKYCT